MKGITGGCNTCKHHESKIIDVIRNEIMGDWMPFNKESFLLHVHKCNKGEKDLCHFWWKKNGGKKPSEELEDMLCFEPHEHIAALSEFVSQADDILKELKK